MQINLKNDLVWFDEMKFVVQEGIFKISGENWSLDIIAFEAGGDFGIVPSAQYLTTDVLTNGERERLTHQVYLKNLQIEVNKSEPHHYSMSGTLCKDEDND